MAGHKKVVASYRRKYLYLALVNRLEGLSLPGNTVVRLTELTVTTWPKLLTVDVEQQNNNNKNPDLPVPVFSSCCGLLFNCIFGFRLCIITSFFSLKGDCAFFRDNNLSSLSWPPLLSVFWREKGARKVFRGRIYLSILESNPFQQLTMHSLVRKTNRK